MTPPVRVLLVDDHPLARRGIATLVQEAFGECVLRETATTADAIMISSAFLPHLVVLDLRLPHPPGPVQTCTAIKQRNPDGHILIVTAYAEIELLRQCLAAGADGVLLKDAEPADLVMHLRQVAAGHRVIDAKVAQALAADLVGALRGPGPQVVLSPREREVLDLLAQGCSNRQIANRLFIAETTVKGYVAALLDKLGVESRLQAVVVAVQRGLV